MHFSLSLLLAASSTLLSGITASPVKNESLEPRQGCTFWARTIDVWHEDGMSRRRVSYGASKDADWGYMGGKWREACDNCGGSCNNVGVYYHGAVGTWVVDSNEVLGVGGDGIHECNLKSFKEILGRELGCSDAS
ncbi:hypothetical protein AJ79_09848 [Helicocarpus griseus UAMH5409]|uniref:Uncharacterized protein n=1 Tax=Helicocarpus griseus UAMH5409 TaxID=1447875 RepID=A0A2B7WGY4_9EURO|nr:hypothetical protein AJ79_09848 [Helicocarpus griseus UAMH5409]